MLLAPLRIRLFRRMFAASLLSEVGDWAARFALAVLVYDRTGSTAITGVVTAVSLGAWLGPGQLLASLADRYSRRTVLVVADLLRAVAFALVAAGVPLPLLLAVVFLAGLVTPPAHAAAAAVRPALVPRDLLPAASVVGGLSGDLALVLGTLTGGALVAAIGAPGALWFNAATFALSAWLVREMPDRSGELGAQTGCLRLAARVLLHTPPVRRAGLLVCAGMGSASAGIAMLAPYVLGRPGGTAGQVAWLTAFASVVALVVTAVAVPHRPETAVQLRAVAVAGLVGGLGLLVFALEPSLPLLLVPLTGLGVLQVVLVPASALVGPLLPDDVRATCFSMLMGTLTAAQVAGAGAAGLLAEHAGPGPAIAVAALPVVLGGALHLARPLRAAAPPADAVDDVPALVAA